MRSGTQEVLTPKQRLVAQLQDAEYRRGFVEGHATDTIAFQLRAMRKEEGWEQRDVAEKLGNRKLQPMISRYENPDYGKYSISTLLELAAAFDVALAVRFVPFSELVEWDFSENAAKVSPPSFSKDQAALERVANGKTQPEGLHSLRSDERVQDTKDYAASPQDARKGPRDLASDEASATQEPPTGRPGSMFSEVA